MVTLIKRNAKQTRKSFKPPSSTDNAQKWTDSISSQILKIGEKLNVKFLPLDQLKQDPFNARKNIVSEPDLLTLLSEKIIFKNNGIIGYDQNRMGVYFDHNEEKLTYCSSLISLAKSINSSKSLLNPITVYQEGPIFHIIAGHRRYFAHTLLNEPLIKATILEEKPDPLEKSILQWKENEDRADLNLIEKITNIETIISEYSKDCKTKVTYKELARLTSLGNTICKYYLKVINEKKTNANFHKVIANNYVSSLKAAYNLCSLEQSIKEKQLEEISKNKFSVVKKISQLKAGSKETSKKRASSIKQITDTQTLSKIIRILANSENFAIHKQELINMPLKSKIEVHNAWKKVITLIKTMD